MLIFEVEDRESKKLVALATFLSDRADDETAKKQISQNAFVQLAKSLGVNVTEENLAQVISTGPLQSVLEPFDPASGIIRFKGNPDTDTGMSVDRAEDIVDKNAKSAMRRMS